MRYIIDHTSLHFGIPELIALIFMLVVIVIVWKKLKNLKDRQKDLEDKAAALSSGAAMEAMEEGLGKIYDDVTEAAPEAKE